MVFKKPSLFNLKRFLIKYQISHTPPVPKLFFNGSRKYQILHARLRLECSCLNAHLYSRTVQIVLVVEPRQLNISSSTVLFTQIHVDYTSMHYLATSILKLFYLVTTIHHSPITSQYSMLILSK